MLTISTKFVYQYYIVLDKIPIVLLQVSKK